MIDISDDRNSNRLLREDQLLLSTDTRCWDTVGILDMVIRVLRRCDGTGITKCTTARSRVPISMDTRI